MDAMGVVYPQYWLGLDAEENFTKHILLKVIIVTRGHW
jgi:hypothetical protein